MSESLEQRKKRLLDEMMAAGAGGFTGAAAAEGPVAGYDPVMSTPLDRALKRVKKKRKKKSD